jgi:Protein of unknown function (DUF1329)
MEKQTWLKTLGLVVVLVLALGFATGAIAASAEEAPLRPGTVIDRSNVDKFAEALSPAMYYAIAHGLSVKTAPSQKIEWPAPYQQATEKYSSQVSLDENDALKNYVAGLPFPTIDAADPKAAVKIAYNWRWGPFIPEQVSFSNLAARTFNFQGDGLSFVRDSANPDFRNELTCDQAIVLRRAHRVDADSRGDGAGESHLLWEDRGEQCGPEQGKFIALLYEEAHRQPDSYVYLQAARKWRRLAIPTVPNQSCSYTCSQIYMEYTPPETRVYSWKLAGMRNVLGCIDAGAAFEESSSAMRFGQISCEPRRAYVLEMNPIAAGSDLLKARVYLDSETYAYLGAEIFRDQKPDLSAAFWMKDKSASDGRLVLAADLYVPDDHPGTFLWLDMRGRQSFDNQVADELFNPKAQQ